MASRIKVDLVSCKRDIVLVLVRPINPCWTNHYYTCLKEIKSSFSRYSRTSSPQSLTDDEKNVSLDYVSSDCGQEQECTSQCLDALSILVHPCGQDNGQASHSSALAVEDSTQLP